MEESADKKLVIGIIGRSGSGKGSCSRMILDVSGEHGVHGQRITFSDLIAETLHEYGVEASRDNLQQLAIFMNDRKPGAIAYKMRTVITNSPHKLIVIDGMRWWPDYELIRSFENNFVIYLTASEQMRFERLKARSEKPGEAEMNFDQFMSSEKVGTELEIDKIGVNADVTVDNDGPLTDLRQKLSKIWDEDLQKLVSTL